MTWFSGLAGKAENFLNKIDQNTAAVLRDNHKVEAPPLLTEVTWNASPEIRRIGDRTPPGDLPSVRITGSASADPLVFVKTNVDTEEELSPGSEVVLGSVTPSPPPLPLSFSSVLVANLNDNADSVSDLSERSGGASSSLSHTSNDVLGNDSIDSSSNADFRLGVWKEKLSLKNEVKSLCNELSVAKEKQKLIENEYHKLQHQFQILRKESEKKGNAQKEKRDWSTKSSRSVDLQNRLKIVRKDLEEKDELLDKRQTDYQKEIDILREKLQSFESRELEGAKQMAEIQLTLERTRSELNTTRSELERYRARALKTLQEKEKLILELRNNMTTGIDDVAVMELNQLRQEREILREENQEVRVQLKLVQEELVNADIKVEKIRQTSADASALAQDVIVAERRKRLEVEEDARNHSQEVKSLKEELEQQYKSFTSKIQEQDLEISRMRSQLSAAAIPNSEVETRLASLTQTLVVKQQALEHLTTERNALRLQLEKIEHEYKIAIGNFRKDLLYNSVNYTDDAKAQVPTFLMETPFDTGVARRVKRAYSSLDAVSVRTGVFLRRYPLARILVLVYMALLHFWVFIVLLSHSPEVH